MRRIPCVYMRGGTSKAIIFHKKDLPDDRTMWPEIFLKTMGTPDIKQIDGMGGTVSSTSKIAVISPSERPDADIDYYFVQVGIDQPVVLDNLNCGNISSAVGPFAIDEGLVAAKEPETVVRIYNENTQKIIESRVQVEKGKARVYGEASIEGVPGTGSPIQLYFCEPGGAATGRIFPTGEKKEWLEIPDYGRFEVTIADISNLAVFVRAADVGLTGTELTELNANQDKMELLERIRCMAAQRVGLVKHWEDARVKFAASPKIGILASPKDYVTLGGQKVLAKDMDLCCRMLSLGVMHKAYPMTYAIATTSCAKIAGTLAFELARHSSQEETVRLGHAGGVSEVQVVAEGERILKAGILRTARRIMDGYIYIP